MNTRVMGWHEALASPGRVLLIVNSDSSQRHEITRCVDALSSAGGLERVSAIAPAAIGDELIGRGVAADSLLRFEVEAGYFLQSDTALQWAVRQRAAFIVGSEPYALNNEEVKSGFEERIAPMLGHGCLIAHTLPADQVVVLTLEDIWKRAWRPEAVAAHHARVATTIDRLHAAWSGGQPAEHTGPVHLATQLLSPPAPSMAAATSAAVSSCRRLHAALQVDGGYPVAAARIVCDPPGQLPRGGFLDGRLDVVRRPAQVGRGVRLGRGRMLFRGRAEGPYSYLVMSRPVTLSAGDAAVAEGDVYRGGITIGLVKGDVWASRVDIVDRGAFVVAAIATEPGDHSLVMAHCLHGQERRAAVAVHRFGFRRAD
jgi:hypothetical protein